MTTTERTKPPMTADERTSLESWLEFYRSTLFRKCADLDEHQIRAAAAEPSPLTLLGLLQHMAEVERNWFRRVLAQEDAPPILDPGPERTAHDAGFDLAAEATYDKALRSWQDEVARARGNCARYSLDDTGPLMTEQVSLRWIYLHMIGEYARHCGHADLIRERIDGSTGV